MPILPNSLIIPILKWIKKLQNSQIKKKNKKNISFCVITFCANVLILKTKIYFSQFSKKRKEKKFKISSSIHSLIHLFDWIQVEERNSLHNTFLVLIILKRIKRLGKTCVKQIYKIYIFLSFSFHIYYWKLADVYNIYRRTCLIIIALITIIYLIIILTFCIY